VSIRQLAFYSLVASALAGQSLAPPTANPAPPPPAAPAAAAAVSAIKLGKVTVSGSFRTRQEAWDWFQPDSGDPSYLYSGNLFRVTFSQSFESWDWQVELAVPFLLGLPNNAVAPGAQGQLGLGANYFLANDRNRNSAMLFPKQAFLQFKARGAAHRVKVGRFEFMDGSELAPKNATLAALKRDRINMRLIGHFGWAHVGRSFDGVHYSYTKPSGNFTFVGAIPTRGVFQTDGWGETNSAFGYASFTKPWGKGRHNADTRVFAIHYHDWRQVLKTDNRPVLLRQADMANIRVASFGGHSLHALETKPGTVDVLVWGLGQTGRWGRLDHRACALALEAGFQPRIAKRLKPWVRGGFFRGSGDGDPSDSVHRSFFQILPTPRPFARFPFFNLMNNQDLNAALILRPHAKVTVSSEFHALRLASSRDLWYLGGGVFQPWTFGYAGRATSGNRSLANLFDTSVEWRARRDVTLTGYIGYAQGKAVTEFIYPRGRDAKLGYLELMYRF